MILAIEFRNCAINLGVFPEKAMTGESLTIETNFLNIVKKKIAEEQENLPIWCNIYKKKCLFGLMFVWFNCLFLFNLMLLISKVFGEDKELRFLGWCANYDMKTYSDGVSFCYKNYLVHRNSDVL